MGTPGDASFNNLDKATEIVSDVVVDRTRSATRYALRVCDHMCGGLLTKVRAKLMPNWWERFQFVGVPQLVDETNIFPYDGLQQPLVVSEKPSVASNLRTGLFDGFMNRVRPIMMAPFPVDRKLVCGVAVLAAVVGIARAPAIRIVAPSVTIEEVGQIVVEETLKALPGYLGVAFPLYELFYSEFGLFTNNPKMFRLIPFLCMHVPSLYCSFWQRIVIHLLYNFCVSALDFSPREREKSSWLYPVVSGVKDGVPHAPKDIAFLGTHSDLKFRTRLAIGKMLVASKKWLCGLCAHHSLVTNCVETVADRVLMWILPESTLISDDSP
jgi:hypothetical protein